MNTLSIARVLSAFQILMFTAFSLDVFSEGYKFPAVLLAFFIHMIPAIVLILFLVISIKDHKLTGSLYLLTSIAFTSIFKTYSNPVTFILISVVTFAIGLLFLKDTNKSAPQTTQH